MPACLVTRPVRNNARSASPCGARRVSTRAPGSTKVDETSSTLPTRRLHAGQHGPADVRRAVLLRGAAREGGRSDLLHESKVVSFDPDPTTITKVSFVGKDVGSFEAFICARLAG